MEEENRESLGAGIITISVLYLIGAVISAISSLGAIFFRNMLNEALAQMPVQGELGTTMDYISSLVVVILSVVAMILILNRKAIGIYIYGVYVVLNIITSIISNGFDIVSILISLAIPILMAIFIFRKKNIFWPETNEY